MRSDKGYVVILVLIVTGVASLLLMRELVRSGIGSRTTGASSTRAQAFYQAERGFEEAVTWLRSNSTAMALQFNRINFYSNFDRLNEPAVGSNDLSDLPSRLRSEGGANAILLTNSSELGTSEFPTGIDAVSGDSVDPENIFSAATFNDQIVKITVVDAIPIDPSKDYGDSPNPGPETDFAPVYRIDSMNATDSGAHVFGFIKTHMSYNFGMGFYGKELLELSQSCDSYISNNGSYSSASKRANCSAGSDVEARVHQNTDHYGSLQSNGTINEGSPWGGDVCADFNAGCPNKGETCEGEECNVPGLPSYSSWATYCPSNQGNTTIAANQTVSVAGNAANQKCWNAITVNNNRVLTLNSTSYPYFIDTFNIANNSVVAFNPSPSTGTINLYVRKFVGDKFNGNQIFNTNNKPYQLRIHYLGTDPLTLNGTASMNAFIVAPYADVTISGNFTFQGGIKAQRLYATGSGTLRYDESGDITTISDMNIQHFGVQQFYR